MCTLINAALTVGGGMLGFVVASFVFFIYSSYIFSNY